MNDVSSRFPYAIAIIGGTVLWTLTAALGGRTEPWDTQGYWSFAYPLSIALAALMGYAFPQRPWRWALALTFSQLIVMILGGSGLGLLPLGLILLGILSVPAVVAASLSARFARTRVPG